MSDLADAFVKYSSTVAKSTAEGCLWTTRRFLRWIVTNKNSLSTLVIELEADYRQCAATAWEDTIALWRADLIANDELSNVAKYNALKELNTFLKHLATFGVVPKLSLIRPPKAFRASRPTRTLAEVSCAPYTDGERLIEKALSRRLEGGISADVKNDFLKTLIEVNGTIAGTPEERAKLLMKINSERLSAIRRSAEVDFTRCVSVWEQGQRLLKSCDMTFQEIANAIPKRRGNKYTVDVFPQNDDAVSLSRLLFYLSEHPDCRGLIRGQPHRFFPHRIDTQIRRFGGLRAVEAYLLPSLNLTFCTMVIILCDTGANLAVAWGLRRDCLQDAEDARFKIIKGHKTRGRKLIIDELPIKDRFHELSCVQAIQTYQKIAERIYQQHSKKKTKFLFLCVRANGTIDQPAEPLWSGWFNSFRKRHESISTLPIHAKMIRPSVLMQACFDKETSVIAAATLADHSSFGTTNLYVSRYPTRVVWEAMIRQFQSLFQAVAIYTIKGAALKLGLSTPRLRKLFGEACRTGLGVACLDSKAGMQIGSVKGATCTQLQRCPSCPNRVVVATVENLRDLIIWNDHLEKSRPEWEFTRPQKWERDWLPWLVFTRVVIEQASRGRTAAYFKKANSLAKAMITTGEANLPLLW